MRVFGVRGGDGKGCGFKMAVVTVRNLYINAFFLSSFFFHVHSPLLYERFQFYYTING